jgi:hypothetical protein
MSGRLVWEWPVTAVSYLVVQGPPEFMTVFQTAVLIRRSNFYRKCKVEMKEHMLEIVHKLYPENHLP